MKCILALDQGTTSSRAIAFSHDGKAQICAQKEFRQIFPQPGWVEHDPMEIWASQEEVMLKAAEGLEIAAIGITNQRETTVVWDADTGLPIYNAIVWQDRRTAAFCENMRSRQWPSGGSVEEAIRRKTGLLADPYFSGTKIRWILDNVPGARSLADQGRLRFGTIDCWLVWQLTGGKVHVTDVSNASRTMLFNINTLEWDSELLELLDVPSSMLPKVCSSSEIYGTVAEGPLAGTPVAGMLGDQQAALFGQMCTGKGDVKNTYGTGCFLLMNCGETPVKSQSRLLTTVAWKIGDKVNYALEGSVFVAGSAVQWLRDGLGIIRSSSEVEALAASVPDSGGVCFVPALTGLGAPYWNAEARGMLYGLTRGTTAAHVARATLEGIAFEVMDVVDAMMRDSGICLASLKVDGGASRNNLLMQFQSDILGAEVIRPANTETTAIGAAFAAGLAIGFWPSVESLRDLWQVERRFSPGMPREKVFECRERWLDAIRRVNM